MASRHGPPVRSREITESHLAFHVDDMDAALALHKEMDCVCFENPDMGIYFINDPDGYWVEICPQ